MIKLSIAALAKARNPGFCAFIFSDVKTPTGNSADYKQAAADDLSQMGLVARTEDIFYGKPTGRNSERTTMAVVAEVNNDADRWLRSIVGGWPLAGSVLQAAEHFGVITLRDGSVKAKVQLISFDGDAYGVFAFVESVLLLKESQSNERLSLTQQLMINPIARSAAAELIATQDEAIARYTAGSASEMLEPEQRCASTKKAAYQRNLRDALNRAIESPENYILVATQPLKSFPCLDALGVTAQRISRGDSNREASQRRSSLGWAFARESSIATVIVRKDCQASADSRTAMLVAQRLLRTAIPPAASVLRPTGSVPDVTLVKPTKMAENRITAAVVKAKLHVLACDQPWAYGAIATSNAGNTDQATYTIPHSLDTNVAEMWADSFCTISGNAGTPVNAIVNDDHFSITTLPSYTGPEVHVYSVEDIIVGVNAETAAAVDVDGVTMEFTQAEVADATPTNLRRAVEAGNHLPAITRWSPPSLRWFGRRHGRQTPSCS